MILLLLLRMLEYSKDSDTAETTQTVLIFKCGGDVFFQLHVRYHSCTFHLNTKMYRKTLSILVCMMLGVIQVGPKIQL